MSWVVETDNATKQYGDFIAVHEMNLRIAEGEVFGLLGPNGAGKTTTILMLLGLTEPTSGHVHVFGYEAGRNARAVKRLTGYLPENVGFYEDLTPRENLAYVARLNGLQSPRVKENSDRVLDLVGLSDVADKQVGKFSRGMVQRLGLAAALVKEPKLVILDEPTLGIDPEGVEHILSLIMKMREEENITILLSSHLLHQVQRICDRIGIVSQGELVVFGSVDEVGKTVMTDGKSKILLQVSKATEGLASSLEQLDGVLDVEQTGNFFHIACAQDIRLELSQVVVATGALPLLIKTEDYTLEEMYVKYFRER